MLKIIIIIAVIFALKWLWVAISTGGQGSFDGEKSEILRRRNYLAGKLITSPRAVLNEMPDGIGSQFKGEWAIYSCSMFTAALVNIGKLYPEENEKSVEQIERLIEIVMSQEFRKYDADRWHEDPLDSLDSDSSHMSYLSILAWMMSGYKACRHRHSFDHQVYGRTRNGCRRRDCRQRQLRLDGACRPTTGGLYTQVGELYGFPIKVVSERILKEGLEFTDNRFVVEGNYKYTYNNGHLAMADPVAAARNFLNAIERIPSIIDQYKAKNEVLEREIPQLQDIAGKVWKKEDELKQLKSELAALDRKIQLELAPPTPEVAEKENDGQQVKPEMEDVRNGQPQYHGVTPPQIRSPADSIVANHVIIGRPGLYAKEETRSKGLKI